MAKVFRAILIDPERRNVTVVETTGSHTETCHLVQAKGLDHFRIANHDKSWDYGWVDEQGLGRGHPIHAFKFSNGPDPKAGRCLIVGCDRETGDTVDVGMSRVFIRDHIEWLGLILPEVTWDETEVDGNKYSRANITYSRVVKQ